MIHPKARGCRKFLSENHPVCHFWLEERIKDRLLRDHMAPPHDSKYALPFFQFVEQNPDHILIPEVCHFIMDLSEKLAGFFGVEIFIWDFTPILQIREKLSDFGFEGR